MKRVAMWLLMSGLATVQAAEWESVVFRGKFDDRLRKMGDNWLGGTGEVAWSVEKRQLLSTQGDLELLVSIPNKSTVLCTFLCERLCDLGAMDKLPEQFEAPDNFTRAAIYRERILLEAGHAYCIQSKFYTFLVWISDIHSMPIEMVKRKKGVFLDTLLYNTEVRLKASMLTVKGSVDDLAAALETATVKPTENPPGERPGEAPRAMTATAEPMVVRESTPFSEIDKPETGEADEDAYESFRRTVKEFIAMPVKQANLQTCDDLLKECKKIANDVETDLFNLGAQQRDNNEQHRELSKIMKKTESPEIRKRIEGILEALQQDNKRTEQRTSYLNAYKLDMSDMNRDLTAYRRVLMIMLKNP